MQYAYFAGLPWRGIELVIADRALTGVFPTHHGEACIWICSPSADTHNARRQAASRNDAFTAYLHRTAPALAARLRHASRTSPVAGMLRTPNYLRKAHGSGWALVGDAGYHRDAVTGHGLSDAYRDAELLAVALHWALRGQTDEATALAGYPPLPEFIALQKELGRALDAEAAELAARSPVFPNDGRELVAV